MLRERKAGRFPAICSAELNAIFIGNRLFRFSFSINISRKGERHASNLLAYIINVPLVASQKSVNNGPVGLLPAPLSIERRTPAAQKNKKRPSGARKVVFPPRKTSSDCENEVKCGNLRSNVSFTCDRKKGKRHLNGRAPRFFHFAPSFLLD